MDGKETRQLARRTSCCRQRPVRPLHGAEDARERFSAMSFRVPRVRLSGAGALRPGGLKAVCSDRRWRASGAARNDARVVHP